MRVHEIDSTGLASRVARVRARGVGRPTPECFDRVTRRASPEDVGLDQPFDARLVDEGGQTRVVLSGDIDLTAVSQVFARVQEAVRMTRGAVVVMMQDVELIDSSGLGVLARLAAAGVEMELRGAHGVVRRALEISGLDRSPNVRVQ